MSFSRALAAIAVLGVVSSAWGARALGIDVSDWQGTLTLSNWQTIHKPVALGGGGKDFAFIRSTRGGTTGTYNEYTRVGTLSERYDDLYFVNNITRATQVGMFAGPYHFARPDIVTNTGVDEANHMLEIAGPYMKPGYMRPVLDLEAGDVQRTTAELTQFAIDFATTIYNAKGVYPIVYINSYYANTQVSAGVTIMDLWIARWPNQADPSAIDTEGDPPAAASYPNVYGVWNPTYPTIPNPTPWKFWQYASTGSVPGISGNVDLDVAHGDIEFVKDFLIPAIWQPNSSGQWTTATNWNSNPGLPGPNDRVIIDRPAGSYTITLSSGVHSIRSLFSNESLAVNAATLSVEQYIRINGNLSIGNAGRVQAAPGAATVVVQSLSISGTGKLDLTDNAAIIDYTDVTPIANVRLLLNAGAIISSTAPANMRFGYADNTVAGLSSFAGQPVDSTSILIRLTHPGDTNLDGAVDITDLATLASNWQSVGPWTSGDFTYNGIVDIADLALLATNWQLAAGAMSFDQALAMVGLGGVPIPEPAVLGAAACAAALARMRTRRRSPSKRI